MNFQIGSFTFISLEGQPPALYAEQVETTVRPGVEGVALWRTNRRSNPFVLVSRVDAQDIRDAHAKLGEYGGLVGADPVKLIYQDTDFETEYQLKVAILDVTPLVTAKIVTAVGGKNGPSEAWVEAQWTMVFVREIT